MTVVELHAQRATLARFTVHGIPVPQGSKNAIHRGGRTMIVERGRAALGPWRAQVAAEAARLLERPATGALRVRLVFVLVRPKSHYRTGRHAGELRDSAPRYVSTRPDVDKLSRAVLDALTGVAFADDGQVAELEARKVFGERAGVTVELKAIA